MEIAYAFDQPVLIAVGAMAPVTNVEEARNIVRTRLGQRFTLAGLNTLLLLERAAESDEVEEARQAFHSWAANERLLQVDAADHRRA